MAHRLNLRDVTLITLDNNLTVSSGYLPEKHQHKQWRQRKQDTSLQEGKAYSQGAEAWALTYPCMCANNISLFIYKIQGKLAKQHTQAKASGFFFPFFCCVCLDSCHNRISVHYPGFEHWSPHTLNRCRCAPLHPRPHHQSQQGQAAECVMLSGMCSGCKVKDEACRLACMNTFFFSREVQRWDQSRSEHRALCDLAAGGSLAFPPGGEYS